jgi:hypothetical protein
MCAGVCHWAPHSSKASLLPSTIAPGEVEQRVGHVERLKVDVGGGCVELLRS